MRVNSWQPERNWTEPINYSKGISHGFNFRFLLPQA